jgi:hypothetical protein
MDLEEDKEVQRVTRQNQKPYLSFVDTLTINAGRVWGFPPSSMSTTLVLVSKDHVPNFEVVYQDGGISRQ